MKTALIRTDGTVVGWEAYPVKLIVTADGGSEQDPNEWWQAFITTTKILLRKNPQAKNKIIAICCSTQGEGTIPVDRQGNPLSNCILWMDMRGAENLKKQLGGLINIDGANFLKVLRYIQLTGGMPSMTGKDPAGHMLYIRDQHPDIYAQTYKFLNVLDYLNLKLTGEFVASFDSIVTSWVTDNRNPDDINYHQGLINTLGIDADKLPEIVSCQAVIGNLQKEVAEVLDLPQSIKIVAGAIDNTAAAIGAGAVKDYLPHLYIGTSSWVAAHVPYKKTDIASSMASIPCAMPGKYLLTALQATAGGNLTYLRDNILYHQDELLQEADVPDIFKVLDQIAERVPPGSNGVIYTPWIWGERAPVDDRAVRAGLYNISLKNNREDIIRAFLEGVAFNTNWLMKPVNNFLKEKPRKIHIVGGGAQSPVWCQIFADVLNLQVVQISDPIQANARGAAWIAAAGMGEIDLQDVSGLVKINQVYHPKQENCKIYADKFRIFKKIYKQMSPIYKYLNG
ncbi:MAG: FGGY-family carbohydrate kinase [Anaerolineaceae bacterium]|nr:FGGY-family carbohydrate kinase [Anaerolineaceae bacterium]